MTISLYDLSQGTFAPMLRALSGILDRGAAHARTQELTERDVLTTRLAPDMYTLTQQVQLACSNAREGVAQLLGRQPPPFAEDERSIDELKRTIAQTIEYLDGWSRDAFDGADVRRIEIPLPDNLAIVMTGVQFLRDWAIPHFYFHVVTAYDLLRHRGVEIGKRDYLARLGEYIQRTR